jgi:hypothetical protein
MLGYMSQSDPFILWFEDLPDDIVQDKVDELITYRFENSQYEDDEDLADRTLDELLADEDLRLKTYHDIMDLFPYIPSDVNHPSE